jgi:chromosome partitioning protein
VSKEVAGYVIYAVANQKGGVGKTTTTINLAATLAQAGERVLLVDIDPQANASTGLGIRVPAGEPAMLEVLLGEAALGDIVREGPVSGLWVAPASPDLAGAAVIMPGLDRREFRLRNVLAGVSDRHAAAHGDEGNSCYSYIFIDCPPSLGLLTVNALVAAQAVIVPIQAEYYALEGMAQLMGTVDAVRGRLNPSLRIAGLVLTMVDVRTNLAREVEAEVRRHFADLAFRTVVPRNVRLAEAPSHGLPVSMIDPHCPGSDAYFDLAQEVVERG